jgi:TonB family protein
MKHYIIILLLLAVPLSCGHSAERADLIIPENNSDSTLHQLPPLSDTTYVPDTTHIIDGYVITPPECLNLAYVRSSMVYPKEAKEKGIEGRIVINVLVDQKGNVIKTKYISGEKTFLEEVSSNAVNLKFKPATLDGKPIIMWFRVLFNFKL